MKKTIALILFAFAFKMVSSQSNEIRVDVFDILALLALDVTYEHNLNTESSIGISALFNFADKDLSFRYQEELVITTYYRQRLYSRGNFDYFGELFGALNKGDVDQSKLLKIGDDPSYTDFAMGLSFGGKFVSPNGFVADMYVGIGRNFFNTDFSPDIVPRVGISVGKRF